MTTSSGSARDDETYPLLSYCKQTSYVPRITATINIFDFRYRKVEDAEIATSKEIPKYRSCKCFSTIIRPNEHAFLCFKVN